MTIPLGLPPWLPSKRTKIPLTAAVPAALNPMSRAISQRRATSASATKAITMPIDPAW